METPLLSDVMTAVNQVLGGSFWIIVIAPFMLTMALKIFRAAFDVVTEDEFAARSVTYRPSAEAGASFADADDLYSEVDDLVDDDEEDDDDYLTCAYCSTDNPYGARSCSSCGAPARKAFR